MKDFLLEPDGCQRAPERAPRQAASFAIRHTDTATRLGALLVLSIACSNEAPSPDGSTAGQMAGGASGAAGNQVAGNGGATAGSSSLGGIGAGGAQVAGSAPGGSSAAG